MVSSPLRQLIRSLQLPFLSLPKDAVLLLLASAVQHTSSRHMQFHLPTFGSFPFSIFPIWRAISVLPVPGGPYSSIPCVGKGRI